MDLHTLCEAARFKKRPSAKTLILTYPDAPNDPNPWILYLGSWRTTRRGIGKSKGPPVPVTYICGINLNQKADPYLQRMINIIQNRLPSIFSYTGTQARVRRVQEILNAFDRSGGNALFKTLYRTYIKEPGIKTKKHRGIVNGRPGPLLVWLSIEEIGKKWGKKSKAIRDIEAGIDPSIPRPPSADLPPDKPYEIDVPEFEPEEPPEEPPEEIEIDAGLRPPELEVKKKPTEIRPEEEEDEERPRNPNAEKAGEMEEGGEIEESKTRAATKRSSTVSSPQRRKG